MRKYYHQLVTTVKGLKLESKKRIRLTAWIPEDEQERIQKHAEGRGFKITSDYIRRLIEDDMKAHGIEIDLSPDRGGYRPRRDGEDEEEEE